MRRDVDPGPEGDLVLLQQAVDHDRLAAGVRRRLRLYLVPGCLLALGWATPLMAGNLLIGLALVVAAVVRLQRAGHWSTAVTRYGLGLVAVASAGIGNALMVFTGFALLVVVGTVGFGVLAVGYVRVLRGRRAAQLAHGLRNEVALRQRRRSEQARHEAGRRRAETATRDRDPSKTEPRWPSADAPPPVPDLPPWEQRGLVDPDDALQGGFAAMGAPDRDRRPALDIDGLRPGFHGWDKPDASEVATPESGDVRAPEASDPPTEG